MVEWFEGPWFISSEESLEKRSRLDRGEILIHKSGNLLLNCPACNALQFSTVGVENDTQYPSLLGVVQCGNGGCLRCKALFTVRAGKTVKVDNLPTKKKVDWSHIKGIKNPPKIEG